jgi:integrase
MPKKRPEPFWREQTKCFYVQIGKKQHRLDPDEATAWRLYHELMARPPEQPAIIPSSLAAVEVVDLFLDWCQKNRDRLTYEAYRRRLQNLADGIPHTLPCQDLKPYHLTRIIDSKGWNSTTKNDFLAAVQRAFNWALTEGIIAQTPLAKLKKPAREIRELAVTPADYAEVMEAVEEPNFRALLDFAWETGVRPQEVVKIEARHIAGNRIVLPPREAKGKKRHRIIYLTEAGMALVAPLAEQRPAGPLFRNSDGSPWNKDSINCAMRRLRLRLAEQMMDRDGHPRPKRGRIPRGLTSQARADRQDALQRWKAERARYVREKVPKFHLGAWRKGYTTQALKNGVELTALASLLGHQDGRMIATTYGKVYQDHLHMEEMAKKARKS